MASLSVPAVALLLGPPGDASAVAELERLSGTRRPAPLAALVAARAGDAATARRFLAEFDNRTSDSTPKSMTGFDWGAGMSDWRPVLAETYYELRDYPKVVEVLERFEPSGFGRRGFDPRWVLLPRVRLLRGQALEKLGRMPEASVEYQGVIDQWGGADSELLPVVQLARQRLARVGGTPEIR